MSLIRSPKTRAPLKARPKRRLCRMQPLEGEVAEVAAHVEGAVEEAEAEAGAVAQEEA